MNDCDYNKRLSREKEHATVLLRDPEKIWGWHSHAGLVRAQRRAKLIIEAGQFKPDSKTFEIGCGTGLFTGLVSESGSSITACELSSELLEIARKKQYHSKVTFINNDVCQLPDEHNNLYDVVWGSSVVHHLDLEKFLPKLYSLLKPGGIAVFAEPNMFNPQIWLERNIPFIRRVAGVSPDETAFYRWSLNKTLVDAGFINVSVKPHEFLHPALHMPLVPLFRCITAIAEKIILIREFGGSLLIRAEKPI